VPALAVPDRPDLDALVLGSREDGSPWAVRLARGHLLAAGPPGTGDGAGRESVVWSLVRALAARVRDGSVELWGIDGRGGLELAAGAPLFARLAAGDPGPGLPVVEDAAALVRARRPGGSRDEPLVVLVMEEITGWGSSLGDADRRRLDRSMELVLARGAAAGVIVVATMRSVPASAPAWFRHVVRVGPDGVALASEGRGMPERVRAAGLSDDGVAALAHRYRPARREAPAPPVPPPAALGEAPLDDGGTAAMRRTA
jgi:hypothetical protein